MIDTVLLEYIITNYRWFFVTFFLLPISVTYDLYFFLRNWITFVFRKSAPEKHDARVRAIAHQVKQWIAKGKKNKMCTARPGWQAMSLRAGKYKKTYDNIRLDLHDILDINTTKRTVTVEPMVSMGQITHSLLPLGWIIPVLPELDDLTVGGLVNGTGIETSSHRHGLFQHICVAFEIVLSDGSIVKCSEENYPELFHAIPWSHGTLGFLVSVEIQIIPCKSHVALTYIPYTNKTEAMQRFEMESKEETFDFVECLAYSPEEYVVMLGNMTNRTDKKTATFNAIGRWYKEWFYIHVKKFLSSPTPSTEVIPIRDYFHRHSKSLFWEIQDIVPFGNNILFRYMLGWAMPPKPSLMKLTQTEALRQLYELHHVVQDMLVPIERLSDTLDVFDREVNIYPLWLCPFKIPNSSKGFVHVDAVSNSTGSKSGAMYVDIGAYGNPSTKTYVAKDTCRRIEEYVRSVKGYQMMYADSYMTKEEFRSMFDHELYDQLRMKIPNCTEAFPEVYDKVSKAARI